MSATDEAKRIRAEYKRRGWSSRMVSVRSEYFSLGSAVNVTIKSAAVDLTVAEEIALQSERISRCEITGEILGGGNRYVSVSHSSECRAAMAKPWLARVRAALAEIPAGDSSRIAPIEGAPYPGAGVSLENTGTAQLWLDGRAGHYFHPECGLESPAFSLALRFGDPPQPETAETLRAEIEETARELAEVRRKLAEVKARN